MSNNTWREVLPLPNTTKPSVHKGFVEIDSKGNRTGRIKHVYPGATAADNDMEYIFIPHSYCDTTGGNA